MPLQSTIWTKQDGTRNWEWRIVGIFGGRDAEWDKRANLMYLNCAVRRGAGEGRQGLAGVFGCACQTRTPPSAWRD